MLAFTWLPSVDVWNMTATPDLRLLVFETYLPSTCWSFIHIWLLFSDMTIMPDLHLLVLQTYRTLHRLTFQTYLTSTCWCFRYIGLHTCWRFKRIWLPLVGVAGIRNFTPVDVSNIPEFHLLVFQSCWTSQLLVFQTCLTSTSWCFRHIGLHTCSCFRFKHAWFSPIGVPNMSDFIPVVIWLPPVGVSNISDFTPADVSNIPDLHRLVFQAYRTSYLFIF